MKRYLFVLMWALLTAGGLALGTSSASAHTPKISASCDGVELHAANYDANADNTWTVTRGGDTQSGSFGASLDLRLPVDQGGASTTWSASISGPNGTYATSGKGTVGPCGTLPQPDADVERTTDLTTDCDDITTVTTTTTTTEYVLKDGAYVPGQPVSVVETSQRDATPEEIADRDRECIVSVTPVEPTVTDIDDCGDYGSVLIPNDTDRITYELTGGDAKQGDYEVTATAADGFEFPDGTNTQTFTGNLGSHVDCGDGPSDDDSEKDDSEKDDVTVGTSSTHADQDSATLPDTGGADILVLLAGLFAVTAGGAFIAVARRRTLPTA